MADIYTHLYEKRLLIQARLRGSFMLKQYQIYYCHCHNQADIHMLLKQESIFGQVSVQQQFVVEVCS